MKTSFKFILPSLFLSGILFYACSSGSNDCTNCCNETDAMYGEERDMEAGNANAAVAGESDNADANRNTARSSSGKSTPKKITSDGTAPGSINATPQRPPRDPENSGNGNGEGTSALSSEGENIGNNNTLKNTGAAGSASSPERRGNSGQGRPY